MVRHSHRIVLFVVWFVLFLTVSGNTLDLNFPSEPSSEDTQVPQEYYADDEEPLTETYGEPEPTQPPPPPPVVLQPDVPLDQKTVMIGRTPYLSLKEMMNQARVLLGYLKKEIGAKEVRLVTAKNYAGVLDALSRGTIDFAWVGPTAYVIGKEKYKLLPIAKARHLVDASYRGVFITRKGSNIQGLDDIKGKTIGFVDPESASGYLYPLFVLQRLKINPHKACAKVLFLKKHDAVLAAVLERKIDVGVCLEATLTTASDKKLIQQLLVLGKTDEVPSDIIVCREDCPLNLREAFQKALLKRTSLAPDGKSTAPDDQMPAFLPAADEDFESVRTVLKSVGPR